jgi:single-strand DNA-binding protein
MSIAKAVISGKIVRNPEKRFTSNDLAITSFGIDISEDGSENLLRVVLTGKMAEKAASSLKKNDFVVIEGRLQTNTAKTQDGQERKIVELMAQNFELMGQKAQSSDFEEETEILEFSDDNVSDDLIGEDEIPF